MELNKFVGGHGTNTLNMPVIFYSKVINIGYHINVFTQYVFASNGKIYARKYIDWETPKWGDWQEYVTSTDTTSSDIINDANKIPTSQVTYALGQEIDALRGVKTATLTTTWSGSTAPFTQEVSVAGVTANDTPIIDLVVSSTQSTAQAQLREWSKVSRIVTSAGKITAYCYTSKPTVALPIQIKGV